MTSRIRLSPIGSRTPSIFLPKPHSRQRATIWAPPSTKHRIGLALRTASTERHESYRFGDLNYAREELRAELASVFLLAERGIPHNPDNHAAYLNSWLNAFRGDKHEIFRAARDAHKTADFLMALEMGKSLDQALAQVGKAREESEPFESEPAASGSLQHVVSSKSRPVEMEL
ncbi:MAG: hypothetical protein L0338_33190 [Acidobacteria bacterium]|nr:hypothetical protein [Acidobacteriota bacterium]